MTPMEFLDVLNEIDILEIAGEIVDDNLEQLAQLQRNQMLQGKNNQGELFSPRHSDNPYFKKPGAGMRYAEWKYMKFPQTPFDVPNLTVIGVYHDSISFTREGDEVIASASAAFADDIDKEFGNTALGLNEDSLQVAWETIIREPMLDILAKKMQCDIEI